MGYCKRYVRRPAMFLAGLFLLIALPVEALDVHHDLQIALDPAENRLEGLDTITVGPTAPADLVLHINEKATGLNLLVDGRPAPFSFENGRLHLKPVKFEGNRSASNQPGVRCCFRRPGPRDAGQHRQPGLRRQRHHLTSGYVSPLSVPAGIRTSKPSGSPSD